MIKKIIIIILMIILAVISWNILNWKVIIQ
jgi:hypothetical protein